MNALIFLTVFLLQAKDGRIVDVKGVAAPDEIKVSGVEIVRDAEKGEVMRVTGGKNAQVLVPDNGRLQLKSGFTIEAEIFLEKPIPKGGFGFVRKSVNPAWGECPFELSFKRKNLNLNFLHFKGEPIEWRKFEGMHEWELKPDAQYPGAGNAMNGLYEIVTGRWTQVAFTWNPRCGYLATAIDHGIDREAFNPHHGNFDELIDEDDAPVRLFRGAEGIRVKSIRVSDSADLELYDGVARAFVTENPYRRESYVHVKPVRDDLPLPFELTVENVSPPHREPIAKYTVTDLKPHNYPIPKWEFANSPTELVVRMIKDGREFWHYETLLGNPGAASPGSHRMIRGDQPLSGNAFPKHPDWWIERDNTITFKGKPVFPLMISHVPTNAFDLVADIGFNMIGLTLPGKTFDRKRGAILDAYCALAAEKGVWIQVGSDKLDRPGEGFLYAFDEPWGHSFAKMYAKYRYLRAARQRPAELIVTGGQNNWQRYRETGCVTDILAVDPYWRGRTPLRSLYDSVRYAIRDTDGLKPVTLDIGCYGPEGARPNYDELRTQSYLGVVAGARSLYYYTWKDDDATDTAKMPKIIANYRRLFAEFKTLEDVLTVPNVEPGPVIAEGLREGFFVCLKAARGEAKAKKGRQVFFAVSDLYAQSERTLCCPSAAGKTAELLSGSDLPGCSPELVFDVKGRAKLALPPLGCGIYEVRD